jgi:DNA primase
VNTNQKFVGFLMLKSTVTMGQVLDRYGLLERLHLSGDELCGVCPLHRGHNQTQFRVNTSKNCWMCFGDCQAGGGIVDFVSRMEGVGIREAALLIQDWFDVRPPGAQKNDRHEQESRPSLNETAQEQIKGEWPGRGKPTANPPLKFALLDLDPRHPYLAARGLSEETLATFGVGHCTRGMLAGWIAIPIQNAAGELVAYAGRWPGEPPEDQPKYRLPKGFRKSLELFNLHRARVADSAEPLIVVEGFFGCMALWQAGWRRVVSTMGSLVSEAQLALITQTAGQNGRVQLMFDSDPAGQKGQARIREKLARSVKVRAIQLDEKGQQPDQLAAARLRELLRWD